MPDNSATKKLLISSYKFSATRILQSLQGSLTVSNSREPGRPPQSTDEVVGLCGQGGRHQYFKVQATALVTAVQTILQASQNVSEPDQALEAIESACEELRRRTTFETGTGCVNDQVPAMVPLLPPEEIWLNGRELPLDVWRLISFEFDLVSSGVATASEVDDFAFSAVNPNALAFRYLIKQLGNKRVQFDLTHDKIPLGWVDACQSNPTIEVSVARLYFEAGCLLTPWAGTTNAQWFAAIRYLHWLDATSLSPTNLRVKDKFDNDSVDSRYRGIFAEETAVGMMAVVLSDILNAGVINNTVEWIAENRPHLEKIEGPMADFITQALHPTTGIMTTIIAESKGSLGGPVIASRKKHAKKQLKNTNAKIKGTTSTLPLAFCSSIRFLRDSTGTNCEVSDPPDGDDDETIQLDSIVGMRLAYAKALKFVGLETAAKQALLGKPVSIRPMDFEYKSEGERGKRDHLRLRRSMIAREKYGFELLLDAGIAAVGVDSDIYWVLTNGLTEDYQGKILEVLGARRKLRNRRFEGNSFDSTLGLGCIFYNEIDG